MGTRAVMELMLLLLVLILYILRYHFYHKYILKTVAPLLSNKLLNVGHVHKVGGTLENTRYSKQTSTVGNKFRL